jgi:hypothetical protein
MPAKASLPRKLQMPLGWTRHRLRLDAGGRHSQLLRAVLAHPGRLRHSSDSGSYRGHKRSAPARRCHACPGHYSPVPCSVGSGFARARDDGASTLLSRSAKTTHVVLPGCAGSIPSEQIGNALSGIPALRKIKFLLSISRLAADDPIIHTSQLTLDSAYRSWSCRCAASPLRVLAPE